MGRLMGLDYGSKTVGVALSDLLHINANSFEVVRRPNEIDLKSTIERIVQIINYNRDVGSGFIFVLSAQIFTP